MTKRIIIFVLILSILLTCACTQKPAGDTPSTPPSQSVSPPPEPDSPSPSPVSSQDTPSLPAVPAVRVSAELEDGCVVIAGHDVNALYDTSVPYVYLYADEPVYDLLVSGTYMRTKDASSSVEYMYTGGNLYVPALSSNQAILMPDPYPSDLEDGEIHCTHIAYTNSAGKYETVQLFGEAENNNPSLEFAEPRLSDKIYSEIHYGDESYDYLNFFPEDFSEKMLQGDFDDYIPKGFCIMNGSLGDVNGDGTQDALICLMSSTDSMVAVYSSIVPLFVLIGQPDGGYVVEYKVADALFTPYRSKSFPVAGDGYIDVVYSYTGGAASHRTQTMRFFYDKSKNDWLLKEFSYQPTCNVDYSEELPSEPVRPLPDFAGLPLKKLTRHEFYYSVPDWDYFDAVCDYAVPSYNNSYSTVYTLAVNLNESTGYYEGYIYNYYESLKSGGFIQTIRGEYSPDTSLVIKANAEDGAFTICGDVWTMAEYDSGTFHLTK